jgi:hypothetical protein
MILSVIASFVSFVFAVPEEFILLTFAIEDNSSCFSLKNFSILSLSFIILSVTCYYLRDAELSLFSVRAEDADPYLSGLDFPPLVVESPCPGVESSLLLTKSY